MAGAKLEKTRWPGIYRRGDRYVVLSTATRTASSAERPHGRSRTPVRSSGAGRAARRMRPGG